MVRADSPVRENLAADFFRIVAGRRGHFRLESGHHSQLWIDLDPLFADPSAVDPFVEALSDALRPYALDAVCGPLLGGAFLAQLVARRLKVEFAFTERGEAPRGNELFQVQYRLPPAFATRLRDKRIAIVDDVMSAGSALRGTYAALCAHGAVPVVAGALLVLGSTGVDFFSSRGVPVDAMCREPYSLWEPGDCPLCRDGVALEDVAAPAA